jgi:hypothetical protein
VRDWDWERWEVEGRFGRLWWIEEVMGDFRGHDSCYHLFVLLENLQKYSENQKTFSKFPQIHIQTVASLQGGFKVFLLILSWNKSLRSW